VVATTITTMRVYCKKDGHYGRWAWIRDIIITILPQECIFEMDGFDI